MVAVAVAVAVVVVVIEAIERTKLDMFVSMEEAVEVIETIEVSAAAFVLVALKLHTSSY